MTSKGFDFVAEVGGSFEFEIISGLKHFASKFGNEGLASTMGGGGMWKCGSVANTNVANGQLGCRGSGGRFEDVG